MTTKTVDYTQDQPVGLPPAPMIVPDDVLRTAERLGVSWSFRG